MQGNKVKHERRQLGTEKVGQPIQPSKVWISALLKVARSVTNFMYLQHYGRTKQRGHLMLSWVLSNIKKDPKHQHKERETNLKGCNHEAWSFDDGKIGWMWRKMRGRWMAQRCHWQTKNRQNKNIEKELQSEEPFKLTEWMETCN